MQEYGCYGGRTHIAHGKEIHLEEGAFKCAVVCKLVHCYALRYVPTDKQACKETAERQEYLCSDKVETVHERLAEEAQTAHRTDRQRAQHGYDAADGCNYQ